MTSSASRLLGQIVFLLLSGREFLWPGLMDVCHQKEMIILLLFGFSFTVRLLAPVQGTSTWTKKQLVQFFGVKYYIIHKLLRP